MYLEKTFTQFSVRMYKLIIVCFSDIVFFLTIILFTLLCEIFFFCWQFHDIGTHLTKYLIRILKLIRANIVVIQVKRFKIFHTINKKLIVLPSLAKNKRLHETYTEKMSSSANSQKNRP